MQSVCDRPRLDELGQWLDETIGFRLEEWMETDLTDRGSERYGPLLDQLETAWRERSNPVGPGASEGCSRRVVGRQHPDTKELVSSYVPAIVSRGSGRILLLNLAKEDDYAAFSDKTLLAILRDSSPPRELKKKDPRPAARCSWSQQW